MSASSWPESLSVAAPSEAVVETVRWSLATRVAFRFVFSFLLLSFLPFPLSFIPGVEAVWYQLWANISIAIGRSIFHVPVSTTLTGSGDSTFGWIQLLVMAVVAIAATLVWSIVDRKSLSYPRLFAWFRVYLRFALAMAMISYGSFKVIPSQFVPPALDRLIQPFGDSSPMGMLWTFMGVSMAYTIFTGIGELAGGLLLTMRRTALLGALISAAVMAHVVVLNFCYDVPVKIYSSQLLLTALVIAAPDAKRLSRFFLTDHTGPLVTRRGLRIAGGVLAALFVVASLGMSLNQSWEQRQTLAATVGNTPLYGVWNVDELTVDGVAHPPLTTDTTRWRRVVIAGKQRAAIQLMDDSRTRFVLAIDDQKHKLTLTKRNEPKSRTTLSYRQADANTLLLDGTFEGKKIVATLRKTGGEKTFLINSRGFHWINEVPFNR